MRRMATIIGCIACCCMLAALGCGETPSDPAGQYDITKDQARNMSKADWGFDWCEWMGWYGDGICDDWCPDPDPDCEGVAGEGEGCGSDIEVECGHGLYCAMGGNWCGTPPVVGVCLQHGDCIAQSDCLNENNRWEPPSGQGITYECVESKCQWTTTPLPQPCLSTEQCGEEKYCSGNPDGEEEGVCLGYAECENVEDCNDPENLWMHPMCLGYPTCEEGRCGWECGDIPVYCESSDVCGEDQYCNFVGPPTDEACTSDEDCGPNGSCWDGMCVTTPGECLQNGACQKVEDCYHPDNQWVHPGCVGHAECNQGQCAWVPDNMPIPCASHADCPSGMVCDKPANADMGTCVDYVPPPSCAEVGGVCISTVEPPPPGTCAEHGLADTDAGVCMGYDEVCCVMASCNDFWYSPCPGDSVCVDIPFDDCDPGNGGINCAGMCVDGLDYDTCGYGLGGCGDLEVCLDAPDGCDPQTTSDCPGACVNPY